MVQFERDWPPDWPKILKEAQKAYNKALKALTKFENLHISTLERCDILKRNLSKAKDRLIEALGHLS